MGNSFSREPPNLCLHYFRWNSPYFLNDCFSYLYQRVSIRPRIYKTRAPSSPIYSPSCFICCINKCCYFLPQSYYYSSWLRWARNSIIPPRNLLPYPFYIGWGNDYCPHKSDWRHRSHGRNCLHYFYSSLKNPFFNSFYPTPCSNSPSWNNEKGSIPLLSLTPYSNGCSNPRICFSPFINSSNCWCIFVDSSLSHPPANSLIFPYSSYY